MTEPKGRKSSTRRPAPPAPSPTYDVIGTPTELHRSVSLAGLCAKAQAGPGGDWISNTAHVLHGLERAIYGVLFAGKQPLMGPLPDPDASVRLLENVRDLALDFLAANGYRDRPKFTRIKDFKPALIGYMLRLDVYRVPGDWSRHDALALAIFLQSGTILFPQFEALEFNALVSAIEGLGPDFLRKTKIPADRIDKVVRAAGLSPTDVWRLLGQASAKSRSRARQRDAGR